jgi:ATP-dependent DNA helicase RecG
MLQLQQDIQFLKGVGPKRAELLNNELRIFKCEDLLLYFPFRYIDRSKFYKIKDIHEDLQNIQIKGKISNFNEKGKTGKKILTADFYDETGTIELIWFKGTKYIKQNILLDKDYIIFGKPARYGSKLNIAHPEIDDPEDAKKKIASQLQAVYPSTELLAKNNVHSKIFRTLIGTILSGLEQKLPEQFPDDLKTKLNLVSYHEAVLNAGESYL